MKHIQNGQFEMQNTCVAFGHFDGIHTGHQAVAEKLVQVAREKGLAPVLVSLEGPSTQGGRILTTENEKCYLLRDYPLEAVVSLPARALDEDFVAEVLVRKLGAKAMVVGKNHPSIELFRKAGGEHGCDVVECEVVEDDGQPVDTQRVLDALNACDVDGVTRLLGHPYIVIGEVVKGKQLGRTVGQPTANIDFSQAKQLLPDGSYATVTTADGVRHVGLTNVGKRPTVDNYDYTTIENHILDFSGDLYGKELVLEFRRFIRGVDKFNSLAEMQAQVAKDVQAIRDYLDSLG